MSLKVFIKKIALLILALAGYCLLIPFWPGRRKNKLVILRYHSISDCRRHEVNVKVKAFRQQMEFLAKYYKPISLIEAVEALKRLPENAVAVTFDDGYKDNHTHAYPVVRQLNIPVTIFLTAAYIGTEKLLPHDIGENPLHNRLLSWDEIREMKRGGIEFGSHTLSHANLGREDTHTQEEIRESKRLIEKESGSNIRAISYPFGLIGDFNPQVKAAAYAAGYICGCSAMNGVNNSKTDIFELRRIGIEASDNMFTFRAKLNGALDLLMIKDTLIFNRLLKRFNRLIGA